MSERCAASVSGGESGLYRQTTWKCDKPAKGTATMHRFGDTDVERPACGVHLRVARTTGRVYEA